jgi:sugar/nucleoside kinase (ribokinase family)
VEYIVAGNVMIDSVYFANKSENKNQLGGPAIFAYSGVNLWTDNALLVSNVGRDFYDYFNDWIRTNNVSDAGILVKTDYSNHMQLEYIKDGNYVNDEKELVDRVWENLGYLKITPEDIEAHTINGGIKGLYIAQNCDSVIWDKLGVIKERDKFKIMWEIEAPYAKEKYIDKVIHALSYTDVFSINLKEAQNLFGTLVEEEIIEQMKQLPTDMIIFRVGERGLYTIHKNKHYFHPTITIGKVIDPTGCGNASTGAALYAYCEYKDPISVGIKANVTAAFNTQNYGVIPDINVIRDRASMIFKEQYKKNINTIPKDSGER